MSQSVRDIEDYIRSGNASAARTQLKQVAKGKIPRRDRLKLATFARRLSRPELGMQLLHRLVRPSGGVPCQATEEEKVEYAACLLRIGAGRESLEILKAVNTKLFPESLLFQAFALVSQWEYRASIPVLQSYQETPDLTPYQRAVGDANLAAALVYEREENAKSFVDELLQRCQSQGYQLLIGHLLMMEAEDAIFHEHWNKAESYLNDAKSLLSHDETLESLFIQKWRVILKLYRDKNPSDIPLLNEVRQQATLLKHWETIRNCDYHQAIAFKDISLLHRVYYGTQFPSLKQRLLSESKLKLTVQNQYIWTSSEVNKQDCLIVNPFQCLKEGSISYRLLGILASDFYRPIRVATVYSQLYPEEYFNPTSSPARVHQAVTRLRKALESKQIDIEIEETKGFYQLKCPQGHGMTIPLSVSTVSPTTSIRVNRIQENFGFRTFTAKQVAHLLGVSVWTAIRLLNSEHPKIVKEGMGKKSVYRFRETEDLKKTAR